MRLNLANAEWIYGVEYTDATGTARSLVCGTREQAQAESRQRTGAKVFRQLVEPADADDFSIDYKPTAKPIATKPQTLEPSWQVVLRVVRARLASGSLSRRDAAEQLRRAGFTAGQAYTVIYG